MNRYSQIYGKFCNPKSLWQNVGTFFSSSLTLMLLCLDLIFSLSISAVSSLFLLDSSIILVAATSPAKSDVPEQMSGSCHISLQITTGDAAVFSIIRAKSSRPSSLFFFRCLISKSFSLRSLKSRPFSSLSSLSWSCKCSTSSLQVIKWTSTDLGEDYNKF